MEKERLYPEMPLMRKRKIAENVFNESKDHLPNDMMTVCQDDFKLCSLVGYKIVSAIYNVSSSGTEEKARFLKYLGLHDDRNPICRPLWAPVRYCGGNMEFGRVFAVNHCAFSSRDSIIGLKDTYSEFRILKGLRHIGCLGEWRLFKLDPSTTDDMTGMLYTGHEKNFTIEFAHFPHEGGHRIVFRWEDS